jgi:hypothetical protein
MTLARRICVIATVSLGSVAFLIIETAGQYTP